MNLNKSVNLETEFRDAIEPDGAFLFIDLTRDQTWSEVESALPEESVEDVIGYPV